MKRLIALLMTLVLFTIHPALAVNTAVSGYQISLPGAEISFLVTEDMLCLTRETSASVYRRWGLSQHEYVTYMEEHNLYAVIYDLESGAEYYIYVVEWESPDFDKADDTDLQLFCAESLKMQRKAGFDVKTSDHYRNTGHTFAIFDRSCVLEDGYVENSLMLLTNQHDHEVCICAYPAEGEDTASIKDATKALADSIRITRAALTVATEEFADGSFALDVGMVKLTFAPLDVRYVITRESGRYPFNRMGYDREDAISLMEQNDIYAVLNDSRQRIRVQVHIIQMADAQDYSEMVDWLRKAAERQRLTSEGWKVEELELFGEAGLDFVKTTVSWTDDNGVVDRRLIYGTCLEGIRIEIQVFSNGEMIFDAVEAETDGFVRSIQCEMAED